MAPFAKTTFVQGSTPAADATELNRFGDGIVEAQRAAFVTALPTTGPGGGALADGQECYFKPDPTNATGNGGVAWHLKYEATSGKWYYIGGPPMIAEVAAEEGLTNTAYAALATAGPTITTPLAGDYQVTIGAAMYAGSSSNAYVYMSFAVGATAASDSDAIEMRGTAAGNVPQAPASRRRLKAGLAAGAALAARYRASTGAVGAKNRWMTLLPVRVG